MSTKNLPFLVYGTLRPGFGNYSWALAGATTSEVDVRLQGYRMYAGPRAGFPYVTAGEVDDAITVTMVTVEDEEYERVLNSLDMIEGYDGPGNPENLYDRVEVEILLDKTDVIRAYIYLASAGVRKKLKSRNIVESGDWAVEVSSRKPRRSLVR